MPETDGFWRIILRFLYIVCRCSQRNRSSLLTRFLLGHAVCKRARNFRNLRNPAAIILALGLYTKSQILAPGATWRLSVGCHFYRMPYNRVGYSVTKVIFL